MKKKTLKLVASILVTVGAINWLLIAINPAWDVVAMLAGNYTMWSRIIYGAIGLSGLLALIALIKKR